MELHNPSSETEGDWAAIRPVLDEAIANLGDEDRNALLLRFFKNESLSSVGATLGVSEDAAQKRVSRALDKLRDFLAQRGIKTTAAALSISLAANTIHSAPSGFAPTLAASCLSLTKTAVSTSSGLNLFTFFNLKTTLLSMLIVGGLGVLFIANVRSQRELSDTRKLYDLQSGEIHGLRTEIQQLTSQTNELNRLRNDAREVLRLRNQVTQLRRELAERNALVSTLKQRASDGDLAAPSPSQMNIKAKFISIPSTSFQGGITGTLTSPQLELVLQSLNINEATNLISEGQITLLDQRQGQIQIQGTNGYIISLEVTPTWRKTTGTINLDYRIVSALVADSPRNSLPPGADLPLVEAQEMTNNVNIPDGHTLMASRSMSERESLLLNSKQPGPRTLLILLTPTAIDSVGNRFYSEEESQFITELNQPPPIFPGTIGTQSTEAPLNETPP